VALGLAVVFGLMRIVNMAHGEFVMAGAFITVSLVRLLHVPFVLAVAVAGIAMGLLGLVVEALLIRPLYGKRLGDSLLVTFGLSLVMYQLAVDIYGTSSQGIATPLGAVQIGRYAVSVYSALLPVALAGLMAAVFVLFKKTKYGLLARAAAEDALMANALGVHSAEVNRLTVGLGCGLAGLAGGLIAPIVAVAPSMGQSLIAQAFLTVVTGGGAFLTGTLASSALLGGISSVVSQFGTSLWGVAALFMAAIVILRVRPQGLSSGWKRMF
jgi:branched-chain amino acid transport system permease protein